MPNKTWNKTADKSSVDNTAANAETKQGIEPELAEQAIEGTYTVIDNDETTWVFKLNADNTATITKDSSEENPTIAYWSLSENNDIIVSTEEEYPNIALTRPEGSTQVLIIREGYLYIDSDTANANNPEQRLKVTKTN